MSTNCIRCIEKPRTGGDLLCDECRTDAKFDKSREALGAENTDNFLAKFGMGPKYVPEEPKKHKCPKCGKGNAVWKERHPDTSMNCMALCCPDCGHEEED